jgi:hypothetical protein
MTPPALQFIQRNFETFCEWFDRKDMPDYATWQMIQEDFTTMKASVLYLIERERARLEEKPATPTPTTPDPTGQP